MPKIRQPRRNTKTSGSVEKKKTAPTRTKRKNTLRRPRMRQAYGISKLEAYFAHEFLDKLGLHYIYEYEAKDIGRFYDFAIVAVPQDGSELIFEEKHGVKCIDYMRNNVRCLFLIEVDGGYFHGDSRVVDESKLSPMQKHNKFVDKLKNEWCVKHKIPLLRIWEYDIRNNPKLVFEQIREILNKLTNSERIKAGLNRPHPKKK